MVFDCDHLQAGFMNGNMGRPLWPALKPRAFFLGYLQKVYGQGKRSLLFLQASHDMTEELTSSLWDVTLFT